MFGILIVYTSTAGRGYSYKNWWALGIMQVIQHKSVNYAKLHFLTKFNFP